MTECSFLDELDDLDPPLTFSVFQCQC